MTYVLCRAPTHMHKPSARCVDALLAVKIICILELSQLSCFRPITLTSMDLHGSLIAPIYPGLHLGPSWPCCLKTLWPFQPSHSELLLHPGRPKANVSSTPLPFFLPPSCFSPLHLSPVSSCHVYHDLFSLPIHSDARSLENMDQWCDF